MTHTTGERIYTAAVLIIGNEVLSGRIQDANLHWLANRLKEGGIRLREARVVADVEADVVEAVNALRARHDYLFTTGGIGPTHDDITAECVARAFGVALEQSVPARRLLEDYYGEDINPARLRMANVPAGAVLLENPVSRAPGFRLGNVYVLPGVPRIMQAMFDGFRHRLAGGAPVKSRTVTAYVPESLAAEGLAAVQARWPQTDIGSYPFVFRRRFGSAFVVRSADDAALAAATAEVAQVVRALGAEPQVSDGESAPPRD